MTNRLLASLILIACGHQNPEAAPAGAAKLAVTSSAFAANGEIPSVHTCQGNDVSPPLAWSGAPGKTKSFALIVDDPDAPDPKAPTTVFVHWVLVDIPPSVTSLAAGAPPPDGSLAGKNDFDKKAWGGPCPPIGRHRYFFKVYALDTTLGKAGMTKAEALDAMKGHIVGQGELVGTYQKKK